MTTTPAAGPLHTRWGDHLFQRFCSMFAESSPCLLGQHGSCSTAWELSENFTKPSEQVAAPPGTLAVIYFWKKLHPSAALRYN